MDEEIITLNEGLMAFLADQFSKSNKISRREFLEICLNMDISLLLQIREQISESKELEKLCEDLDLVIKIVFEADVGYRLTDQDAVKPAKIKMYLYARQVLNSIMKGLRTENDIKTIVITEDNVDKFQAMKAFLIDDKQEYFPTYKTEITESPDANKLVVKISCGDSSTHLPIFPKTSGCFDLNFVVLTYKKGKSKISRDELNPIFDFQLANIWLSENWKENDRLWKNYSFFDFSLDCENLSITFTIHDITYLKSLYEMKMDHNRRLELFLKKAGGSDNKFESSSNFECNFSRRKNKM
jgi:hypothetical protein